MQQIMTQCFLAVKSKLDSRLGLFDLIGCDFMVDEDFKVWIPGCSSLCRCLQTERVSSRQVWLLEMNCNPALHTNCEVLKEVVPRTVVETLGQRRSHQLKTKYSKTLMFFCFFFLPSIPDLSLEIFHKCRLKKPVLPLANQREFVLLYNGTSSGKTSSSVSHQIKAKGSPKT